jgi:poly-D-alanine transfer protein DltD
MLEKILEVVKGQPTELVIKALNEAKNQVIINSTVNNDIKIREEVDRLKFSQ